MLKKIIPFIFGCAGPLLLLRLFSGCGAWASHWGDFSCCGAQAVGHVGFSSWGSRAPEHRLSTCGTQALVVLWHVRSSGPGIEPMSPALVGRFFPTEPPGKPSVICAKH